MIRRQWTDRIGMELGIGRRRVQECRAAGAPDLDDIEAQADWSAHVSAWRMWLRIHRPRLFRMTVAGAALETPSAPIDAEPSAPPGGRGAQPVRRLRDIHAERRAMARQRRLEMLLRRWGSRLCVAVSTAAGVLKASRTGQLHTMAHERVWDFLAAVRPLVDTVPAVHAAEAPPTGPWIARLTPPICTPHGRVWLLTPSHAVDWSLDAQAQANIRRPGQAQMRVAWIDRAVAKVIRGLALRLCTVARVDPEGSAGFDLRLSVEMHAARLRFDLAHLFSRATILAGGGAP